MYRSIFQVTLVAGLVAGCAGADDVDDGGSTSWPGDESGENPDQEDGDEEGEVDPPDSDHEDEDLDPQGRITWVGDVDGDLMVHAGLGPEVEGRYPTGVAYRIRIDEDGAAMYAQIVDAQGEVLDLVRVARRAPSMYPSGDTVLSYCFPYPNIPPVIAACYASPCPWEDDWPGQGGEWPNCIETSHEGGMVRIVGAIDGTPFGQELVQGLAPVPVFDTPLSQAQRQRIETVSLVAADIAALQPELDELDLDCFDCMMLGGWIVGQAASCAQLNIGACEDAYWGYTLYEQNCAKACMG